MKNYAGAARISCEACSFQVFENEIFSVDERIKIISGIFAIMGKR